MENYHTAPDKVFFFSKPNNNDFSYFSTKTYVLVPTTYVFMEKYQLADIPSYLELCLYFLFSFLVKTILSRAKKQCSK